jgi:hypothetical protein
MFLYLRGSDPLPRLVKTTAAQQTGWPPSCAQAMTAATWGTNEKSSLLESAVKLGGGPGGWIRNDFVRIRILHFKPWLMQSRLNWVPSGISCKIGRGSGTGGSGMILSGSGSYISSHDSCNVRDQWKVVFTGFPCGIRCKIGRGSGNVISEWFCPDPDPTFQAMTAATWGTNEKSSFWILLESVVK